MKLILEIPYTAQLQYEKQGHNVLGQQTLLHRRSVLAIILVIAFTAWTAIVSRKASVIEITLEAAELHIFTVACYTFPPHTAVAPL